MTEPTDKTEGGAASQYLSFSLGDEIYAMPVPCVDEIIGYTEVTPFPLMPEFIRGAINLRGAVVPVIDLAVRLGRQGATHSKRTCIVVVSVKHDQGKQEIGMVVDAVHAVLDIDAGALEPAPSFGPRLRTDFIAGLVKVDGRFVIVLEIARVLSLDEISLLGKVSNDETSPAYEAA